MPPPREPFDWEADDERRRERASDHWYRGPDNAPLLSGQFWALWTSHLADHNALVEEVRDVRERLVEVRMRSFVGGTLSTLWGRFIVIVLAVLTAFVLTNYRHPW